VRRMIASSRYSLLVTGAVSHGLPTLAPTPHVPTASLLVAWRIEDGRK